MVEEVEGLDYLVMVEAVVQIQQVEFQLQPLHPLVRVVQESQPKIQQHLLEVTKVTQMTMMVGLGVVEEVS
jgi:pantothenate kinase